MTTVLSTANAALPKISPLSLHLLYDLERPFDLESRCNAVLVGNWSSVAVILKGVLTLYDLVGLSAKGDPVWLVHFDLERWPQSPIIEAASVEFSVALTDNMEERSCDLE